MTRDKQPTSSSLEKSKTPQTKIYDEIELMDDKAHPGDLVLKVNGKKVVITEAELGKLLQPNLAKAGKNLSPAEKEMNIQFLGQYGLKSAKDVIAFLKSPTGEKTKKSLNDLLFILVALLDLRAEHYIRQQLLRHLFMAMVRLHKLARKEAIIKLNAAYQRQIDKSLAYGAAVAAQQLTPSTSSNSDYYDGLLRTHIKESYGLATQILENQLQDTLEEAQALENEIALHETEVSKIIERYSILEIHLQVLDDHFDSLETMQGSAEQIKATEAVLRVVFESMKRFTADIQQHVMKGEDLEAELPLNHLDGLNVQAEGLKIMLSVINLQKNYYDADGKNTNSFKKAAYVVDSQQQLYKDKESGKLYLLNPGQNFANLTVDEKAKAHANYEAAKPQIALIKNKINQYKATEFNLFEVKKNELVTRSENLQKGILDLTNQYNQAKAAEASTLALIMEPKTDLTKLPTPKPTMKANQPQLKPQFSPTQSYRQILQLMRFNPTQEAINLLKNSLLLPNGQPNKAAQDLITNTIKPNEIILGTKMNSLLANLERLGVSANKQGPVPSAHPNKAQKEKQEQRASSSPTPLKTSLTPSKF
jgi:hypothetical protein